MKKFLVSMMMFLVFAIGLPLSAEAHPGCRRHRKSSRSYAARTHRTPYYATRGYVATRRPSFYRRHRNLINIGVATGAGALLGGLLGGRRGVAYGLMGGAGAGALYTYKLNPKKRRYYRSY
jgi:outer membrane lipoprotein SlyB